MESESPRGPGVGIENIRGDKSFLRGPHSDMATHTGEHGWEAKTWKPPRNPPPPRAQAQGPQARPMSLQTLMNREDSGSESSARYAPLILISGFKSCFLNSPSKA